MKRVIILLLDSFGLGGAPDAIAFGDVGADTFGHIAEQTQLSLPNLAQLGLIAAADASRGYAIEGLVSPSKITAKYGYASEISRGKDTPSGHWEIAGVPVMFDWGYFPADFPSFPEQLIEKLMARAKLSGVLGNCAASGTVIIEELGPEHIASGKPIVYTSADSVFQIAAHEEHFGLAKLYKLCEITRECVNPYNIGRVIARPFIGSPGRFQRTGNRRDYTTPPPAPTLLDHIIDAGGNVIGIGKTADIFAHQGISTSFKESGNAALFDRTLSCIHECGDRSLIFSNFVDFDSVYGHRRDVGGYAKALEYFDQRLPELVALLQPGDLVIVTADHGCDPTWPGSDHTRENIPVLAFGPGIEPECIGQRETFADIGQSVAQYLDCAPLKYGKGFL